MQLRNASNNVWYAFGDDLIPIIAELHLDPSTHRIQIVVLRTEDAEQRIAVKRLVLASRMCKGDFGRMDFGEIPDNIRSLSEERLNKEIRHFAKIVDASFLNYSKMI